MKVGAGGLKTMSLLLPLWCLNLQLFVVGNSLVVISALNHDMTPHAKATIRL